MSKKKLYKNTICRSLSGPSCTLRYWLTRGRWTVTVCATICDSLSLSTGVAGTLNPVILGTVYETIYQVSWIRENAVLRISSCQADCGFGTSDPVRSRREVGGGGAREMALLLKNKQTRNTHEGIEGESHQNLDGGGGGTLLTDIGRCLMGVVSYPFGKFFTWKTS